MDPRRVGRGRVIDRGVEDEVGSVVVGWVRGMILA